MTGHSSLKTAMILAAGFGTRMKELTRTLPKGLLPIGNETFLDFHLRMLREAGISRVVINLHYLGDMIIQYLQNKWVKEVDLIFSQEPKILGTAGGIAFAEKHFGNETILVLNSDVISDISIRDFYQFHMEMDGIATMAGWSSRNFRDYSLMIYHTSARLTGFLSSGKAPDPSVHTAIFTGYQILTPRARQYLTPEFSSVIEKFYQPAIQKGENIFIYTHPGYWFDLGSKKKYQDFIQSQKEGKLPLTPHQP